MNNLLNLVNFLFSNIIVLSIQAMVVALVVLLLTRLLKKRINPKLVYLLWVMVLIRAAMPVLPNSPISLFNALKINSESVRILGSNISTGQSTELTSSANKENVADLATTNLNNTDSSIEFTDKMNGNNDKITKTAKLEFGFLDLISIIWIVGVFLILGFLLFVNLSFAIRISRRMSVDIPDDMLNQIRDKTGITKKIRVVESQDVSSPCVFGIRKSTILLPQGLLCSVENKTLYNILTHEFSHIKRNDLAVSWLSYVICALHWFNPILWFSAIKIRQCQEVCADAYVMSFMDEEEIDNYGQTLIAMVKIPVTTRRTVLVTSGLNENKNALKERISKIADFSKSKNQIRLAGILLLALAGVLLCTSAYHYPKTAEEKMDFQNNIMMSVLSTNTINTTQDISLEIHNMNQIGIWNCDLQVYAGDPNNANSNLVYSKTNFRIGSSGKKSFSIQGIDYDTTYIKLYYHEKLLSFSDNSATNITGLLKAYDKSTDIYNWGAVTDEEIASFIETKDITPISITKLYDFYTVVMYEYGNTTGYYELWKDTKKNEVMDRLCLATGGRTTPIIQIGGTASGMYPFANIIIDDKTILSVGEKMTIEGTRGTISIPILDQKGYTIETRSVGTILKILIYDKSENLIYDGEKSQLF